MTFVAFALLALGLLFGLVGAIGVIRFPDVFTRLHASGKCATTSVLSILIACMLLAGFSVLTGRLLVIALFFLATNSVASHIIGHSAWSRGVVPWRQRRACAGQGPLPGDDR